MHVYNFKIGSNNVQDDYYNNGDDIQDEDSTESVEAAKNDLSSNAIEADDAAIDLPDEDKYYETERSTTATTMSEDSMRVSCFAVIHKN